VAVSRTQPDGRVIGIDILPVQPPQGVSTIQGNFLSEEVRREVRAYVQDASRGRARTRSIHPPSSSAADEDGIDPEWDNVGRSYVEMERSAHLDTSDEAEVGGLVEGVAALSVKGRDEAEGRVVDVVLSDMCAPWAQTTGTWIKSVSDPYRRMMNTSGIGFKDHAGSMVRPLPLLPHYA
jgi:21S rRNA (uridine2791-2'-O)-methyltransferase